jgi:hypothetical protein
LVKRKCERILEKLKVIGTFLAVAIPIATAIIQIILTILGSKMIDAMGLVLKE